MKVYFYNTTATYSTLLENCAFAKTEIINTCSRKWQNVFHVCFRSDNYRKQRHKCDNLVEIFNDKFNFNFDVVWINYSNCMSRVETRTWWKAKNSSNHRAFARVDLKKGATAMDLEVKNEHARNKNRNRIDNILIRMCASIFCTVTTWKLKTNYILQGNFTNLFSLIWHILWSKFDI